MVESVAAMTSIKLQLKHLDDIQHDHASLLLIDPRYRISTCWLLETTLPCMLGQHVINLEISVEMK